MLSKNLALEFQQLHQGPRLFVLPNAWDAISAKIFEKIGFPAIGTTSAGIAFSHGYRDGQHIPPCVMVSAVQQIAEAVELGISADIESGYGTTPAQITHWVQKFVAAGAVGINLEDTKDQISKTLFSVEQQCAKIAAIREAISTPIVINARTDTYWLNSSNSHSQFEETIRRANAYREAGADCLFIPGVQDSRIISNLVSAINGPINILVGPQTPPIQALQSLGVIRVSLGSGPIRAAFGLVQKIGEEIYHKGIFDHLTSHQIPYDTMNQFFRQV